MGGISTLQMLIDMVCNYINLITKKLRPLMFLTRYIGLHYNRTQ